MPRSNRLDEGYFSAFAHPSRTHELIGNNARQFEGDLNDLPSYSHDRFGRPARSEQYCSDLKETLAQNELPKALSIPALLTCAVDHLFRLIQRLKTLSLRQPPLQCPNSGNSIGILVTCVFDAWAPNQHNHQWLPPSASSRALLRALRVSALAVAISARPQPVENRVKGFNSLESPHPFIPRQIKPTKISNPFNLIVFISKIRAQQPYAVWPFSFRSTR
jgi:hypothetical protein